MIGQKVPGTMAKMEGHPADAHLRASAAPPCDKFVFKSKKIL
jgi:hypothetical protein